MKSISICISEASLLCKSAAWGSGGHTHFLLVELVSLAICHPYRYWIIILYYLFGLQNPHHSCLVFRETTAMHPTETGSRWLIRCCVRKLCQQRNQTQQAMGTPAALPPAPTVGRVEDVSGTDHAGLSQEFSWSPSPQAIKCRCQETTVNSEAGRQGVICPCSSEDCFHQIKRGCNAVSKSTTFFCSKTPKGNGTILDLFLFSSLNTRSFLH